MKIILILCAGIGLFSGFVSAEINITDDRSHNVGITITEGDVQASLDALAAANALGVADGDVKLHSPGKLEVYNFNNYSIRIKKASIDFSTVTNQNRIALSLDIKATVNLDLLEKIINFDPTLEVNGLMATAEFGIRERAIDGRKSYELTLIPRSWKPGTLSRIDGLGPLKGLLLYAWATGTTIADALGQATILNREFPIMDVGIIYDGLPSAVKKTLVPTVSIQNDQLLLGLRVKEGVAPIAVPDNIPSLNEAIAAVQEGGTQFVNIFTNVDLASSIAANDKQVYLRLFGQDAVVNLNGGYILLPKGTICIEENASAQLPYFSLTRDNNIIGLFARLQDVINSAVSGDTIILFGNYALREGIYIPPGVDFILAPGSKIMADISPIISLLLTAPSGANVNDLVTFDVINTDPNVAGCPAQFPAGGFGITARLKTKTDAVPLSDIGVVINEFRNVDAPTTNNRILAPDGRLVGVGDMFAVPRVEGYKNGILNPGEQLDVDMLVCLMDKRKFSLWVDVFGAKQ